MFTKKIKYDIISNIKTFKEDTRMSYYSKKVQKIREILETNIYPTEYTPERWRWCKANCYAYALDIPVSDEKQLIWIPGCISNEKEEPYIFGEITERLKKDLEFLGISCRKDNGESNLYEGEWRIAIYYRPTPHDWPIGFHISRQDIDEIWSEKPSWKGNVQRIGKKSDSPYDLSKHNLYLENVLILSKM